MGIGQERASSHYALLLALETGLLGLFASLDVVLFYIFFEFTLIPLFFLIGLYGGPDRRRASVISSSTPWPGACSRCSA